MTYDQWKLASPYDDEYEPEMFCTACEDIGWLDSPCGVIPCTECSQELVLEDLETA